MQLCTFQENYGVLGLLTANEAKIYFSVFLAADQRSQKILQIKEQILRNLAVLG